VIILAAKAAGFHLATPARYLPHPGAQNPAPETHLSPKTNRHRAEFDRLGISPIGGSVPEIQDDDKYAMLPLRDRARIEEFRKRYGGVRRATPIYGASPGEMRLPSRRPRDSVAAQIGA
jgi:hypothetical protein